VERKGAFNDYVKARGGPVKSYGSLHGGKGGLKNLT